MNFGGIIAGALSGGAQAVGQIADNNLKEQAAMRAEQRSLQLNFEKFKQEADYKLRLDRQAQESYMADAERVTARAGANMRGQDAASLDMLNNQVGGDAPEMSREEIAKLLEENPQYRQVYEQAGYMAPRKQSGIIGEEVRAARELGADPALRKDLTQAQKDMTTAERDAARERRDERRLDQTDDRNADAARRTDALIAKYEQDAGSKAAKEGLREHLTYLDGQRKRLASTLQDLRQSEKTELENAKSKDKDQIKADYKAKRAAAEQEDRMLSEDYQRVRERLFSDPPAAPSPAPAPRPGAVAPAPGGKVSMKSTPEEMNIRGTLEKQLERNKYDLANSPNPSVRADAKKNIAELEEQIQLLGGSSQSNDNRRSGPGAIPKINSREEMNALPKGTRFIAPDGTTRIKS